jgi:hypothetical protein
LRSIHNIADEFLENIALRGEGLGSIPKIGAKRKNKWN